MSTSDSQALGLLGRPRRLPRPGGDIYRRLLRLLVRSCSIFILICPLFPIAYAQNLEPRSYSNTPVGINFLIAGYAYAQGQLAFDPSTAITDAQYHTSSAVLAYARSLEVWGKAAKFDAILPYSSFSGEALAGGLSRQREVSGYGDPMVRFSINFYGAPALSLKEYAGYRQDLIVGASMQVSTPQGQYDHSKLINLGSNRWSFKPELGISKAWGSWTTELMSSATFYTDNPDFNRGHKLSQAPLYAVQGHLIYTFPSGVWGSLNGTCFTGNRTTVDGERGNNMQANSRAGLTVTLPVDRYNSVKLYASSGTSSRTGSDYSAVGVAWQYRWGGG